MSKPPDEIVALIALPPEKTDSVPPLATFVSTALPPLENKATVDRADYGAARQHVQGAAGIDDDA
jgi:hypothetical protein